MAINLKLASLLGGFVLLAACDPGVPDSSVQAVERTTLKADLLPNPNLSCVGNCGQVVFDQTGYCGCDEMCDTLGDCCNDKPQQCAASASACDYSDPDRKYYGKSASKCAVVRFTCDPGWGYFMDACGCGCEKKSAPPPPPCDYSDPDRKYHGKSVSQCAAMFFVCDPGWVYFMDSCGCGCEDTAP